MRTLLWASALVVSAPLVSAQPTIVHAKMDTRAAGAGLTPVVRELVGSAGPAWIGYAVPVLGKGRMCCFDNVVAAGGSRCGGCRLEGEGAFNVTTDDSRPVPLEGSGRFVVLYRVADRRVQKIRAFSEECALDAGGLPFHWLTDVKPADSLALLATFLGADRKLADAALAAVAFHAGPEADAVLDEAVAPGRPDELRKQATFWMGNARGRRGYEALRRLAHDETSTRLREQITFALSQSDVPEAVDTMIEMAKHDASTHVRGQALFWLAQKAGRRAADAIEGAIRDDPETEVKKKAVFALSQLPKDEGVPLLIRAARTNRNPEVRKQAVFWLGQSNDPRALGYFEEVLSR